MNVLLCVCVYVSHVDVSVSVSHAHAWMRGYLRHVHVGRVGGVLGSGTERGPGNPKFRLHCFDSDPFFNLAEERRELRLRCGVH